VEPLNQFKLAIRPTTAQLLDDEETLRRVFVIIVEETIAAGRQGAYLHGDFSAAGDDLLHAQRLALEFGGRWILIGHFDNHRLVGGRGQFGGDEAMIF